MISETSKILSKEHENILKVVAAMETKVQNRNIDTVFFRNAIDFIRNYADRYHHAKEEDILFKEFNKAAEEGRVHCNPVEQMMFEHEEGRKNVRIMESGINEKSNAKIVEGAKGYIRLIREHIFKEDNILYPLADEAFDEPVKKAMLVKFKEINAAKKKEVEQFEEFVGEIAEIT